jgi:hypothetical protein
LGIWSDRCVLGPRLNVLNGTLNLSHPPVFLSVKTCQPTFRAELQMEGEEQTSDHYCERGRAVEGMELIAARMQSVLRFAVKSTTWLSGADTHLAAAPYIVVHTIRRKSSRLQ